MNMFEEALKDNFRFPSNAGLLNVQDLWNLPLTARQGGVSLDSVARAIAREIKLEDEENFVEENTPRRKDLSKKLDILRYIIEDKKRYKENLRNAVLKEHEKQNLLAILHGKKQEELTKLSVEELKAKINAL